MAGNDDGATSDPLWDDICETLLSLAKARGPLVPRRRLAPSAGRDAHGQRMREVANVRPPEQGSTAALALEAFVPGAWLGLPDVQRRMGVNKSVVAAAVYKRLWRRGWVERIENPEAEGLKKLWRLTALGEAVRAAALAGDTEIAEFEERAPVGLAENPWRPTPRKAKPRRSGARSGSGRERRGRPLSQGSDRVG